MLVAEQDALLHSNSAGADLNSGATVAILAGGMGTRLLERSGDLPKAMVPVGGKPVLHHQIELCRRYGFTDIALLVHHRHEKIKDYFKNGQSFGVRLRYLIEDYPRGTAGALRDALHDLADRFLVVYGDTFLDVDLRKFWDAHAASGAAGTLFLHPNDHPQDSDIVVIDDFGAVRGILPYPHPKGREVRNLVNAALYALDRAGIEDVTPAHGKADIAKHMFPRMLELGRRLRGYVSPEYIKDLGTPDRLDKVERDFGLGIPEALSSRQLRKAVFLDRDGTINREVTHLKVPDQVELLPGAAGAIRRLNLSGTLAVVVTNQPVVARGDVSLEVLAQIHARLESRLGVGGAFLNGLYLCPHHPDKGFPGEVPELKGVCGCRKPQTGLIDEACRDLNINRRESWMVGDSTSDIEAGRRAGLRTILLRTGHGGADSKWAIRPDYIASDLAEAVEWVLDGHVQLSRRLASIALEASRGQRLVLIGGLPGSGKSYAAQVLKELMNDLSCRAHILSLDSWLKANNALAEGIGLSDRLDIKFVSSAIAVAVRSTSRSTLSEPVYYRVDGRAGAQYIDHSIGPDDVLIVEGRQSLLLDGWAGTKDVIKVFMKASPKLREERLARDRSWQKRLVEESNETYSTRERDETSSIEGTQMLADYIVDQGL